MELCPICIDKEADVFTECNHGYCVSCLCRIKKCAMCRNPLQRAKLCNQIKQKVELINPDAIPPIFNISNEYSRRYTTIGRNGDIINRVYAQVTLPGLERFSENGGAPRLNFNHPFRELIWNINN